MRTNSPSRFAQFDNATADFTEATVFQFQGAAAEVQEDGLIRKGILRTGHWPVTPTAVGKVKKPLTIVKEGRSDYDEGIIALSDVVGNFSADDLIQIPLAQTNEKDHANKTRNNTGFVRSVWIEDRPEWGEGQAELMAAMDFTVPEVKERVMQGTYADVSSGVPWLEVEDGYTAKLDHVCLTNKPFVKKMTGWLFSDDEDKVEVGIAVLDGPKPEDKPADKPQFFLKERIGMVSSAMTGLGLKGFEVEDISDTHALVKNQTVDKTWLVPYVLMGDMVLIAPADKWEPKDQGESAPAIDDLPNKEELETETEPASKVEMSDLEVAQESRRQRLTRSNTNAGGGANMPPKKKLLSVLEGVELTDEQKAALEAADEERTELYSKSREGEAEKRIEELKALGVTMPGALKLYRKVFLADDGGPAAVLLSDDGKETMEVKAVEVLDLFVDACKGDQGTVQFSDQATDTGNHNPPPKDTEAENGTLEERAAAAKDFLKLGK